MIQASTPMTGTPMVATEIPRIRLLTKAGPTDPISSAVS